VGPSCATGQNDQSDAASLQVLLISDAPVGREQQPEAGFLGGVQQRTVAERVPAFGLRRVDRVRGQSTGQPLGRPVVKEDEPLNTQAPLTLPGMLSTAAH
jgi:hypothetical protein